MREMLIVAFLLVAYLTTPLAVGVAVVVANVWLAVRGSKNAPPEEGDG